MLLATGRELDDVRQELAQAVIGHTVMSDAVSADGFWLRTMYEGSPPFILEPLGELIHRLIEPSGPGGRDALINATNLAHERFPREHRVEPDACRWAEVVRILRGLA
jgi:hypothetical protein